MKILVVGTGSIGRRHIANLLRLGVDVAAFSYRTSEGGAASDLQGIRLMEDLHDALQEDFAGVVVANKTSLHVAVALQAARCGKGLFIEKPLSNSLEGLGELGEVAEQNGLVVEAGFMLRFHPNLIWIRQQLLSGAFGDLMHIRASVGQWLPDWRPSVDHRNGYSASREAGGGVIFDLCHELDVVHWLAGRAVEVVAMARHVSCLDIETEAIAQIGLRLESGALAQIHLDYVRPGYGRELEIVCRRGVLLWDYVAGTVTLTGSGGCKEVVHTVPKGFERNAMFLWHMEHFLRRLSGEEQASASSLEDAVLATQLALACHESARERRFVQLTHERKQ
jgi:predicted dehydrogenase